MAVAETLVASPDGGMPTSHDIETGIEDAQYWANIGSEVVRAATRPEPRGYIPLTVSRPMAREFPGIPGNSFGPHVGRILFTKQDIPIFRQQ